MTEDEKLDIPVAREALQRALTLQYRSALQYAITAGTLEGVPAIALEERLWRFAEAELADVRRLASKLASIEGDAPVEVAPMRTHGATGDALDWLIECEEETIEALQAAIAPTGREGRSEALEHRLEHMIMRKQEQVDALERSRRGG